MKQLPIFEEGAPPLKRYYTIGEVAKLFGLSKSLIRFWESEFEQLTPHKNSKGNRRFTVQNIEQLQLIHHLVKERGFTIEGARQEMKHWQERQDEKMALITRLEAMKASMKAWRKRLYGQPSQQDNTDKG